MIRVTPYLMALLLVVRATDKDEQLKIWLTFITGAECFMTWPMSFVAFSILFFSLTWLTFGGDSSVSINAHSSADAVRVRYME